MINQPTNTAPAYDDNAPTDDPNSPHTTITPEQCIDTQVQIVKDHLLCGGTISTWEAYQIYHITCLAQRVYDLRQKGMVINKKMVTKNGRRFAVYWVDDEHLENAEGIA